MKKTREMRVLAPKYAAGLFACGLFAVVAQGGCADSLPIDFDMQNGGAPAQGDTGGSGSSSTGGQPGTGGDVGTGGNSATGGSFGTGGVFGTGGNSATGGVSGTGGFKATGGATGTGGFGPGTGGMRATGGMTGTGGITGGGGMRATGGMTGTGGTAAGGAAGSAATFTQVYQMIISTSCTGGSCHNPGSNGGFSFSSQSTAYSSLQSKVKAGNANSSTFYTVVNSGSMPPGKKLSSTLIALIASWINAGALNN